jgi:hypothetical protein
MKRKQSNNSASSEWRRKKSVEKALAQVLPLTLLEKGDSCWEQCAPADFADDLSRRAGTEWDLLAALASHLMTGYEHRRSGKIMAEKKRKRLDGFIGNGSPYQAEAKRMFHRRRLNTR